MKFIVKQAAEAPEEKPVELSINVSGGDGWARIIANGTIILALLPDGTAQPYTLIHAGRSLGFVTDSDGRLKVRDRKPC